MWNFLTVLNDLTDLAFVNYAGVAIIAYGISMLVMTVIKGGNLN